MSRTEVVVIGAGPAGLAAATRIAEATCARVKVLDESPEPGGRLRGQIYRKNGSWFVGHDHARGLAKEAARNDVTIECGCQVWSLETLPTSENQPADHDTSAQSPRFQLGLSGGRTLTSDYLIIATGAAETALGLPGWTTPGVFAVGAVQTMINVHRILPGDRLAVIGIDPLSLSIVDELTIGGAGVQGVYLPPATAGPSVRPGEVLARFADLRKLAPNRLLAAAMNTLRIPKVADLLARVWPTFEVRLAGMPIHLRECVVAIEGDECVTAVRTSRLTADGRPVGPERVISVDAVCLSGGLYPLQDLTADCTLINIPELGGHVPLHGPNLQTTVEGLYVAGNITGIESAAVAESQGTLAGAAVAAEIGTQDPADDLSAARLAVVKARASAPLTFMPKITDGRQRMSELWDAHLKSGATP